MNSSRLRRILAIFLVTTLFTLNGCTQDRQESKQEFGRMADESDVALNAIRKPADVSPLTEEDSPWLGTRAIPVKTGDTLPDKMEKDNALVLTFEQALTLDQVATRIQAATGMRVIVDKNSAPTGGSNTPASSGAAGAGGEATFLPADGMEVTGGRTIWQGKLSALLNQVSDRFDAEWNYSDQTIRIKQQVVRTFMLHALAGSTDVGGSVKTSTSTGGDSGLPQQSVDSSSKLALWDEIQKTIDTIINGKARASYSPATGTITIAGYPSAVRAAEEYLKLQNKLRLRRVALEARVLTMTLNKEYNNNLDVDLVIKDAFNHQPFIFSNDVGQDASTRDVISGVLRTIPTDPNLGTKGSLQAAVTALSAISQKIAVEYSGNLVTLSDQPAPLQVATKEAYVARVSGTSSDTTSSTTLEPGTIDIGLSMNLLPRVIEQDRIMLRIALGITDLVQLREFTSGTSTVQLPEVDSTGFLQNAVLQSGETLVLAGFEKKNATYNRSGIGNPNFFALGGGENIINDRQIRVLLITARVLPEEPMNVIRP